MNQFLATLELERRSMIAWSVGTASFVLLMGLVFSVMGGAEAFEQLQEAYPPELLDAFGASDLASARGFLQAEFGSIAPLVFAIYLLMFANRKLAGAEESGQLDHFLARPISRSTYYWSSLAAGLAIYIVILLSSAVAAMASFAGSVSGVELFKLTLVFLEFIPFGLVFLAMGGLTGAIAHHKGIANAIGASLAVIFYALDFTSRIAENGESLRWFTPMGYLSESDWAGGEPTWQYPVFCLLVATALSVAGWQLFRRKQIFS